MRREIDSAIESGLHALFLAGILIGAFLGVAASRIWGQ